MKKTYRLFLILCFLISIIGTVEANVGSYNVAPGDQATCSFNVSAGDKVQITFTTAGDNSYALMSWMVLPNSTIIDLGNADRYSAGFASSVGGKIELHFSNTGSSDTVLVALNYQVDHYILGMPQNTFFLIAVAVLLMVVVGGFVILSRPH